MEDIQAPEPILTPPIVKKPTAKGTFYLAVAPTMAIPIIVWGIFMVWAAASLPPCGGESGLVQLGVVGSWVVGVPMSLFALVAGLAVKDGSPSLKRMCLVTSALVLIPPIVAGILFSRWHCS